MTRTSAPRSALHLFKALATHPPARAALTHLQELAALTLPAKQLLHYHELLLFTKSYPRSRELHNFAVRELNQFAHRIASLKPAALEPLAQSGIIGTDAFYAYDYPNARWLTKCLGASIEVDWDDCEARDDDPLAALIPLLLNPQEADAADDSEASTRELMSAASGTQTNLKWLLAQLEQKYKPEIRDYFYDALQLRLKLKLNRATARTTVDDGPPRRLALWNPEAARAPFDFVSEVKRPLRLPRPVSPRRGRELLNLVHATLLCRLRELYPMTYGNPAEVYDVQFARGVRVVFWMMLPERRLPLEVGWDFLLLKNNVPIAYGGGGLLHNRLEHAINVFDTFRGGEAAWLFAQIGRIAHALHPAPWIVVRKFQLGGDGNTEGLKSGSYWFYDKLGFRSTDSACRRLAERERKTIALDKSHRTSYQVLKQFAQADVVLSLNGEPTERYTEYPLGNVGLLAGKVIAERFAGQRDTLEAKIMRELRKTSAMDPAQVSAKARRRFAHTALLALAHPDFARMPRTKQHAFLELCRLKSSPHEADYARALKKNEFWFAELEAFANADC